MERSLWDGCCLYEYTILENQNNPALVICDLSDSPERGRHEKYQEVQYNLDQVIEEIGCSLEWDLNGMVAVCRKRNGAYFGIDLLGENRRTFLLSQEKAITAETEAVSIATELHIMRKQQLDKIMSSVSAKIKTKQRSTKNTAEANEKYSGRERKDLAVPAPGKRSYP